MNRELSENKEKLNQSMGLLHDILDKEIIFSPEELERKWKEDCESYSMVERLCSLVDRIYSDIEMKESFFPLKLEVCEGFLRFEELDSICEEEDQGLIHEAIDACQEQFPFQNAQDLRKALKEKLRLGFVDLSKHQEVECEISAAISDFFENPVFREQVKNWLLTVIDERIEHTGFKLFTYQDLATQVVRYLMKKCTSEEKNRLTSSMLFQSSEFLLMILGNNLSCEVDEIYQKWKTMHQRCSVTLVSSWIDDVFNDDTMKNLIPFDGEKVLKYLKKLGDREKGGIQVQILKDLVQSLGMFFYATGSGLFREDLKRKLQEAVQRNNIASLARILDVQRKTEQKIDELFLDPIFRNRLSYDGWRNLDTKN